MKRLERHPLRLVAPVDRSGKHHEISQKGSSDYPCVPGGLQGIRSGEGNFAHLHNIRKFSLLIDGEFLYKPGVSTEEPEEQPPPA